MDDSVEDSKDVMVYSDPFYEDLKAEAREYFKGKPRGSHKMTVPYLLLNFSALGLYWIMIYQNVVNGFRSLILPIGFMSWYLSGNIMHDSSHSALVTTPWINRAASHAAF